MQINFKSLTKSVDTEVEKAEDNYKKSKKSAEEIAASAAGSPSQAGDRYHSQGTADIAKQKLDTVLALKNELEEKGESICHEHEGETLFIVENPVLIDGYKIISEKSPLGQKILIG